MEKNSTRPAIFVHASRKSHILPPISNSGGRPILSCPPAGPQRLKWIRGRRGIEVSRRRAHASGGACRYGDCIIPGRMATSHHEEPTSAPSTFRERPLLATPIRDLGLQIAGTPLEPVLAHFRSELQQAGIRRLEPQFYLSTEW